MKRKIQMLLIGLLCLSILIFVGICVSKVRPTKTTLKKDTQLYGVTIDDSWYDRTKMTDIIAALKAMPVKPTVRIVMSKDSSPKSYVNLFRKLHKVAYVMACPVDSYEMNLYKDVNSYRKRFVDAYHYLSSYTDIWEIGNEVNGTDWIKQKNTLITQKLKAVCQTISSAGGKTALTFYYENPKYDHDMIAWIKKNIPVMLRSRVDYGFISYYEDDNEGYQPDWQSVFNQLQNLFPNSNVGMGECGNTADNATENSKIAMVKRYYTMPKYTKHYVGGYFWWEWVQDCVPHENNPIYDAINKSLKK